MVACCFQIIRTRPADAATKVQINSKRDSVPNLGAIHFVTKPPTMPPAIPPLPSTPNNRLASRVVQTKLAIVQTCITATTPKIPTKIESEGESQTQLCQ